MSARLRLAFVATLVILVAPVARAATPAAEREARRAFSAAEAHFKAGQFASALAEYQAGYAASPLPGFLINIAQCQRRLGDLTKARATYQKFVVVAPDSPLVPESAQTLGTILLQPGESTGTLRIEVRGLASGVWILDGLLEVAPPERAQGTFVVVLGSMLPPDGDGDGVPDPIDDCPAVPDPQQKGCSSPTDGGVDAGPDAGPDGGPICGDGGCAPQGAACTSNTSCASGFCADGVCCANDCAGTCRSCNQPASNGLCLGYPLGTDPEMECTTGMTCNGAGACGKAPPPTSKANGELCGAAGECMSGFCTDGVCCNSACNAPCQSCSTGACQAVKSGQDVPECVSPKTCNSHGSCVQSGG